MLIVKILLLMAVASTISGVLGTYYGAKQCEKDLKACQHNQSVLTQEATTGCTQTIKTIEKGRKLRKHKEDFKKGVKGAEEAAKGAFKSILRGGR